MPSPLEIALRYLNHQPRTRREVEQRLVKAEVDEAEIETVIARLKSVGFLDDAKFARNWVEQRSERGLGTIRLRAELMRRGISREIVDEVIGEVEPDSLVESALVLARKRFSGGDLSDPSELRRIAGYLQRRGHKWETIETVLAQLTNR